MDLVTLLVTGLGIAALSWFAWISTQSLLQARRLFRLARRPGEGPDDRARQAVYGRVRVARALRYGGSDVLWVRIQHQVYRRRGKSSSWATVSTQEETADFTIDAHLGGIRLAELPTEVQGTGSWTEVHERSGWLWGHAHGDRRTVYTYLAVTSYASAVGRLDGQTLARDNKLGLLLSPREPSHAAWIELVKGVGGLLAVTAAIAFALSWYYGRR